MTPILRMNRILFLFSFSIIFLSACETFEFGIENNALLETQVAFTEEPTIEVIDSPTQEATQTPFPNDEQLIAAAIAEAVGQPADQLDIAVTTIAGRFATGFVDNGYFLAVKQDGAWQYAHAGQTNPPCKEIEPYDFPLSMVPECMDENMQLVVRSDGVIVDIGDALAQFFGFPQDEFDFTIIEETGRHIMGNIPDGYFLAVNVNGGWQIIYDGDGTPYCALVDPQEFPVSMVPECIDANTLISRSGTASSADGEPDSLDCGTGSLGANEGTAEFVACNIQDGLRSRNTSALLGYMEDPFIIGYWLSEGVLYTPEDFLPVLHGLYNYKDLDYTQRLTFTTDRGQFPELDGRPLEDRYGSDVNVVEVIYSRGWGADGESEALIFISQDPLGDYKWHGMLIGDLDIPVPGP